MSMGDWTVDFETGETIAIVYYHETCHLYLVTHYDFNLDRDDPIYMSNSNTKNYNY